MVIFSLCKRLPEGKSISINYILSQYYPIIIPSLSHSNQHNYGKNIITTLNIAVSQWLSAITIYNINGSCIEEPMAICFLIHN